MSSSIRRRVGFFKEGENGGFDISIHSQDFDDECYAELNHITDVINKIKPAITSFEIVQNNIHEIKSSVEEHIEDLKSVKAPSPIVVDESLDAMVIFAQRVSNFLASASLYLTNSEVLIKKVFGKKSSELASWNEYRRSMHEESFAYRFMYDLRNYSQHYGLPISGHNVLIDNMLTNDKSIELSVYVSRNSLLEDDFNWRKLRAEIENQGENIDIIPLVDIYFGILKKLLVKYIDLHAEDLISCNSYISTFYKIFGIPKDTSPLLFIGEGTEDQPIPQHAEYIPTEQFKWVCKKYMNLKK
ncbi:hypothetical protein [Marinobacterium lutimaris]|uniref:Uncharacterized protein n=1 Tax=Marinobacterium lutimaris TaxID=568106 RepID=A0A1H5XD97_9GAMM|nr:hypothetical protein [Marinobacterium lutimaris]SEG09623.1 hypothetical protein SAMN05444390_1011347 [Marinobacterium lutimaris]